MLMKMTAMGVWADVEPPSKAYMSDNWNVLDFIIVIHGIHHVGSLYKDHLTNRRLNEIALLRNIKVADGDCLTIQLRPALEARQHDGPAIERVLCYVGRCSVRGGH